MTGSEMNRKLFFHGYAELTGYLKNSPLHRIVCTKFMALWNAKGKVRFIALKARTSVKRKYSHSVIKDVHLCSCLNGVIARVRIKMSDDDWKEEFNSLRAQVKDMKKNYDMEFAKMEAMIEKVQKEPGSKPQQIIEIRMAGQINLNPGEVNNIFKQNDSL